MSESAESKAKISVQTTKTIKPGALLENREKRGFFQLQPQQAWILVTGTQLSDFIKFLACVAGVGAGDDEQLKKTAADLFPKAAAAPQKKETKILDEDMLKAAFGQMDYLMSTLLAHYNTSKESEPQGADCSCSALGFTKYLANIFGSQDSPRFAELFDLMLRKQAGQQILLRFTNTSIQADGFEFLTNANEPLLAFSHREDKGMETVGSSKDKEDQVQQLAIAELLGVDSSHCLTEDLLTEAATAFARSSVDKMLPKDRIAKFPKENISFYISQLGFQLLGPLVRVQRAFHAPAYLLAPLAGKDQAEQIGQFVENVIQHGIDALVVAFELVFNATEEESKVIAEQKAQQKQQKKQSKKQQKKADVSTPPQPQQQQPAEQQQLDEQQGETEDSPSTPLPAGGQDTHKPSTPPPQFVVLPGGATILSPYATSDRRAYIAPEDELAVRMTLKFDEEAVSDVSKGESEAKDNANCGHPAVGKKTLPGSSPSQLQPPAAKKRRVMSPAMRQITTKFNKLFEDLVRALKIPATDRGAQEKIVSLLQFLVLLTTGEVCADSPQVDQQQQAQDTPSLHLISSDEITSDDGAASAAEATTTQVKLKFRDNDDESTVKQLCFVWRAICPTILKLFGLDFRQTPDGGVTKLRNLAKMTDTEKRKSDSQRQLSIHVLVYQYVELVSSDNKLLLRKLQSKSDKTQNSFSESRYFPFAVAPKVFTKFDSSSAETPFDFSSYRYGQQELQQQQLQQQRVQKEQLQQQLQQQLQLLQQKEQLQQQLLEQLLQLHQQLQQLQNAEGKSTLDLLDASLRFGNAPEGDRKNMKTVIQNVRDRILQIMNDRYSLMHLVYRLVRGDLYKDEGDESSTLLPILGAVKIQQSTHESSQSVVYRRIDKPKSVFKWFSSKQEAENARTVYKALNGQCCKLEWSDDGSEVVPALIDDSEFFLEMADGGETLTSYIQRTKADHLELNLSEVDTIICRASELLSKVEFIIEKALGALFDLKPENLVSPDWLKRVLFNRPGQGFTTVLYMAPEEYKTQSSPKDDLEQQLAAIWHIGMVLAHWVINVVEPKATQVVCSFLKLFKESPDPSSVKRFKLQELGTPRLDLSQSGSRAQLLWDAVEEMLSVDPFSRKGDFVQRLHAAAKEIIQEDDGDTVMGEQ